MKQKIFLAILSLFCFSTYCLAQADSFDSTMRSSGRIYVVITVILVILIGLILYLIRLDRKMRRIEKDL